MNGYLFALLWVLAASLLGFGLSAVFSAWFKLSRRVFLIPYIGLAALFLFLFVRASEIDVAAMLSHNWGWGLLVGAIVGVFLVLNVRSQPASRESGGVDLAVDLVWLGLAYGLIDALFLNVMPVLAVWTGLAQAGWTSSWPGRIGAGVISLLASLLVTFAYHVGYKEFRNRRVGLVLVGNTIITLAYLISTNPLGAIVSHAVMHLAAVMRGPETTLQLPPHQNLPA